MELEAAVTSLSPTEKDSFVSRVGDITLFGDLIGEVHHSFSVGVGDLGVGDFGETGDLIL